MKRFLVCIVFVMIVLAGCADSNNSISLSREYTGKSANFSVDIDTWLEYDDSSNIPIEEIEYDEDRFNSILRVEINYIGKDELKNLNITQIRMGDNRWESRYFGEPDYTHFFDNSKYIQESRRDAISIDNKGYFVEFTYSDGSTELIETTLIDSQGEISDLNLHFKSVESK